MLPLSTNTWDSKAEWRRKCVKRSSELDENTNTVFQPLVPLSTGILSLTNRKQFSTASSSSGSLSITTTPWHWEINYSSIPGLLPALAGSHSERKNRGGDHYCFKTLLAPTHCQPTSHVTTGLGCSSVQNVFKYTWEKCIYQRLWCEYTIILEIFQLKKGGGIRYKVRDHVIKSNGIVKKDSKRMLWVDAPGTEALADIWTSFIIRAAKESTSLQGPQGKTARD